MSLRELLLLGSPDSHAQGGAANAADDDDDFGLPVFELCLRRDGQTGQLEQQPVALFSPVDLQVGGWLRMRVLGSLRWCARWCA